ncbi:hypothetical protein BUY68_02895 [Staphylococcus epidermidis]|uniref:HK97-gp10 family putative phage morphogenesis protein n=1 Tax=Staphylococcus epidermidis TaxID=1282 RepID=UPI000D1C2990|nr:HK97-gp10 family putative phage morphogenesis protein [Staphylococcus epidermidis]MCG2138256.1 HK97 gp10 family phage protein [Staphylococcus epidermidis]PTE92354.1 hypothetical protein BUY68_02895 [Staphylococcus epidermidis]
MKIDGIDELISNLRIAHDEIEDDADEILSKNAAEFHADTDAKTKQVFVKGYSTGNLARMIKHANTGHLEYEITSKAGYSGFLEYGTRYMNAEPFMHPVYEEFITKVRADFERLLHG